MLSSRWLWKWNHLQTLPGQSVANSGYWNQRQIDRRSILYGSVEVLAQALVHLSHLSAVSSDRDCPMAPFAHIDLGYFQFVSRCDNVPPPTTIPTPIDPKQCLANEHLSCAFQRLCSCMPMPGCTYCLFYNVPIVRHFMLLHALVINKVRARISSLIAVFTVFSAVKLSKHSNTVIDTDRLIHNHLVVKTKMQRGPLERNAERQC